jgi:GntR family transcriptional regulator, gluconate operon transcriptional repressor
MDKGGRRIREGPRMTEAESNNIRDWNFAPLRRAETLSDRTTELLRERILAGDFGLGERLVEARIARQLQISRGPVREALRQLRAEGLVREEPRRGSFVAELTIEDIREIYDLRAAIEARAARGIITNRDAAALDELRGILGRLRQATDDDDREMFAQLDLSFHEKLCLLSGNGRLHRVFVSYATMLGVLLRFEVSKYYQSLEPLWHEHEALFEAIESLDVGRAEEACNEHLESAKERLIELRRRFPESDSASRSGK